MATASHSRTMQIGNKIFQRTETLTADTSAGYGGSDAPITLVAGSAVSSWVKTDANTAAGDVAAASPIATGKVDVYWTSGTGGIRYGVDCTRTTNSLALDGGTGTDFPSNGDTTVVVSQQMQVNITIDGDLASAVGLYADVWCHVDCQDVSSNSIRAVELQADEFDGWDSEMAENPYTGAIITKAMISNGTTTAGTFEAAVLQDSTP